MSSKCWRGALLLLLVGCGPEDSASGVGGQATGGAATGGTSSSGATGGGATGGGATGGGSSGGAASGSGGGTGANGEALKRGQVAVLRVRDEVRLSATFSDRMSDTSCDVVEIGECRARTCDEYSPPASVWPHAGTVTFSSSELAGDATISPGADGQYNGIALASFFQGGERGLFVASGGDVPAFQQEVDVPLGLLLTSPAYVPGTEAVISRSVDLSLSWLRGVEGVTFFVQANSARPDGRPGSAFFSCVFPSAPGQGVIPREVLQVVASGTSLSFFTVRSVPVQAGEFTVNAVTGIGVYNEAKDLLIQPKLD